MLEKAILFIIWGSWAQSWVHKDLNIIYCQRSLRFSLETEQNTQPKEQMCIKACTGDHLDWYYPVCFLEDCTSISLILIFLWPKPIKPTQFQFYNHSSSFLHLGSVSFLTLVSALHSFPELKCISASIWMLASTDPFSPIHFYYETSSL